MQAVRSAAQEAAEDLFFGQVVIIWARWFLILAGAILTLWTATTVGEITAKILPVVLLMAMNFLLHGRYLMERPVNRRLIAAASGLDLLVITATILLWQGQGGLSSQFFVFYYPALVAFAFVFPARPAAAYTGAALTLYVVACLAVDPSVVGDAGDLKRLVIRLTTLAAVGGLATYYWRLQRERRRAGLGAAPAAPGGLYSGAVG
jgi:hypothetical protein